MEKNIKRFLEFNGKNVYFTLVGENWWVAIKPICEALGVNYEQQRKNLKDDEILCQLPCEHTVVAADGRLRKMVCLPEFFIYGWIFSIQSSAPGLTAYKLKCYELLYQHFHGTLTKRNHYLKQKIELEVELQNHEKELMNNDQYVKLKELQSK